MIIAPSCKGDLLKKISVPDFRENDYQIHALGSPMVLDVDFDGIADLAYAGDYSGDLYRFERRGEPSKWSAIKIIEGNKENPITAAPAAITGTFFTKFCGIAIFTFTLGTTH